MFDGIKGGARIALIGAAGMALLATALTGFVVDVVFYTVAAGALYVAIFRLK